MSSIRAPEVLSILFSYPPASISSKFPKQRFFSLRLIKPALKLFCSFSKPSLNPLPFLSPRFITSTRKRCSRSVPPDKISLRQTNFSGVRPLFVRAIRIAILERGLISAQDGTVISRNDRSHRSKSAAGSGTATSFPFTRTRVGSLGLVSRNPRDRIHPRHRRAVITRRNEG